MNRKQTRRRFLADIGKGTLMATVGPALASELGFAPAAHALDAPDTLRFGDLEPLVALMQETPIAKLQPVLMRQMAAGVSLDRLIAAGVLANARTFGGEDYIGFHTFAALGPALQMSQSMPEKERALPVFKVLYRNTNRIQDHGGCKSEVLHPVVPQSGTVTAEQLREAIRRKDAAEAERLFAAVAKNGVNEAFDALLRCVQENTEVHRTVIPYRAWGLIEIVGREHAETLLRQSLRYCVNAEKWRRDEWDQHGKVLTRLLEEHKLLGREPGQRAADDGFVEKLSGAIFSGTPEEAAHSAASALAEGFGPAVVGEALTLAANQLVLRDHGRTPEQEVAGKPLGSVHGDSIGVHSSDSANAWSNMARVSHGRTSYACLILGAWQVAHDRIERGGDFLQWSPVPVKWQLDAIKSKDQKVLLAELEEMIRGNLQSRAAAVVHRWGELGLPETPIFELLLRYAVSEDGALHAEKYFQTVWEDFHQTRPAFRWRHLIGLARVTASEYGRPAPGQAEARELLRV